MTQSPEQQRAAYKRLKNALKPFKTLNPNMPLQYVSTLIEVASQEGQNVSTYATRAGISQSLMSRHLSDLGDVNRHHQEGLGLIEEYTDVMDRRNSLRRLTAKGKHVAWEVFEALKL